MADPVDAAFSAPQKNEEVSAVLPEEKLRTQEALQF
jgi:hypothetical protein